MDWVIATGAGGPDALPALQAALDSGRPGVYVPPGVYHCPGQLFINGDDRRLHLAAGSVLLKAGAIRNRWGSGFITHGHGVRNSKVNNFRLTGAGIIGAVDYDASGTMISIWGDDQLYAGITIDTWSDGIAFLIAGDRIRMRNITTVNPQRQTGNGGIRFAGGSDFRAEDCHIVSGDDCLQAVPIQGSFRHPFNDNDIDGAAYVRCTGWSTNARFYAVVLSDKTIPSPNMTASIRNVSFTDCSGYGGQRGLAIRNESSTGVIEDVHLRRCTLDQSRAVLAPTRIDAIVSREPGAGPCRNITLEDFDLIDPQGQGFATEGDVEDVRQI